MVCYYYVNVAPWMQGIADLQAKPDLELDKSCINN